MAKIQIKSMKLTPFREEYFNREQLLTIFRTNQHLLSGDEKTLRCAKEKNAMCSTAICEWTSEALRWFD